MIYYIILILIIVALVVEVYKLWQGKKENENEIVLIEKEKDEYEELGRGLAEYNQKVQAKKEQAKAKILEMFVQATDKKINNKQVAVALGVSIATARRYLDDLQTQGKIKQVGKTGKKVIYTSI